MGNLHSYNKESENGGGLSTKVGGNLSLKVEENLRPILAPNLGAIEATGHSLNVFGISLAVKKKKRVPHILFHSLSTALMIANVVYVLIFLQLLAVTVSSHSDQGISLKVPRARTEVTLVLFNCCEALRGLRPKYFFLGGGGPLSTNCNKVSIVKASIFLKNASLYILLSVNYFTKFLPPSFPLCIPLEVGPLGHL